MYCIECGQRQPVQEARYCPYCGAALHHPREEESAAKPVSEPAVETTVETAAQPSVPPTGATTPAEPAPSVTAPPSEPPTEPPPSPRLPIPVSSPGRVVLLDHRTRQMRQRLRWTIAALAVLLLVFASAAAWWWWSSHAHTESSAPAIEVERLGPPAGHASEPAPTPPRP